MTSPVSNSAVVIGATGLVGRECVTQLAARPEFERGTAVARRALPDDLQSPRLRTVLIDFDRLDERPDVFQASHVFCALGTTIKQAGSRERFRQVDFGYPLRVAGAGQGGRRTALSAGEQRRCGLCVARVLSPGERGPGSGDHRARLPVGDGRPPIVLARWPEGIPAGRGDRHAAVLGFSAQVSGSARAGCGARARECGGRGSARSARD